MRKVELSLKEKQKYKSLYLILKEIKELQNMS